MLTCYVAPVSLFPPVVGVKVDGKGGEEACSAGEGGDRSNRNKSGSITEGKGIRAGGSGGMNGGSCSGGGSCVDGGGGMHGGITYVQYVLERWHMIVSYRWEA